MKASELPTDAPDAVLSRVVGRLRLPYSGSDITNAIAAHPRPNSLLALVEVATTLGVKTTAGRADESALADAPLPAIVHFNGAGSPGGFAVLEGISSEGFTIWDSVNGSRTVTRELFLEQWSGIVALVERDDGRRVSRLAYLRSRLSEMLLRSIDPPAVMGKGASILRATLGVLIAALLSLAITDLPPGDRLPAIAIVLLSLAGLFVTVVTASTVADQSNPIAARLCARGKLIDCQSVLTSQYSRIGGVPLSDLGIAFFGSITLLLATSSASSQVATAWLVCGIVYAAAVPLSVMLVAVQIHMRQLCTLCLAVHAVNASSATIAWLFLHNRQWALGDVFPSLLVFVLYLFLVLFFVVPYFRRSEGLFRLADKQRRMSATPFAGLAEFLTEAPTEVRGPDCGVSLGGGAGHELVAFIHPGCGRCEPVLREVVAIAGRGWATGFIAIAPRRPEEWDRRVCSALIAVGLSGGAERIAEAYLVAKKNLDRFRHEDPIGFLAAELSISRDDIDGVLDRAEALVRNAEEFADDHVEGTPAIFFDSRPFRAPLAHLEFLLESHPDLIPS